jgi:hypothetical protein
MFLAIKETGRHLQAQGMALPTRDIVIGPESYSVAVAVFRTKFEILSVLR